MAMESLPAERERRTRSSGEISPFRLMKSSVLAVSSCMALPVCHDTEKNYRLSMDLSLQKISSERIVALKNEDIPRSHRDHKVMTC